MSYCDTCGLSSCYERGGKCKLEQTLDRPKIHRFTYGGWRYACLASQSINIKYIEVIWSK